MIDTVVSVKLRNGNKPGFVRFSSGGELSTFSDAVLKTAEEWIGQRVEYTVEERKSKDGTKTYTNLADIKAIAGASAPSAEGGMMLDVTPVVAQLKRIGDGLEKLASLLAGARPTAAPAVDDLAAAQQRLGEKIGADASKAMFEALRAKFADAAELKAAAAKLLANHQVV